jgi:hypothetical protein
MSLPSLSRRAGAALLTVLVCAVVGATAAYAKTGPDDPTTVFVTQPAVVVTEAVSWTRYAIVAGVACLVGVLATLAIQLVVRHSHRPSMAHA